MTPYEIFQLEKYGNVVPEKPDEDFDGQFEREQEKQEAWVELQAELQRERMMDYN